MGSYTTVWIKEEGKRNSVQFYGGNDTCENYNLGDTVKWEIYKDDYMSGHLLDEVYQGIGDRYINGELVKFHNWYVVIKDHKIVEVVPTEYWDEYDIDQELSLKVKYDIKPWERGWWTEEAYQKELEFQKKHDKEFKEMISKLDAQGKSEMEKFAWILTEPIRRKIDYTGMSSRFVIVERLK